MTNSNPIPPMPDEKLRLSSARAFDTLVASNLQLVKTLRLALGVMVLCVIAGTTLAAYSTVMLREDQHDLRDLIATMRSRCP